jgi:hypothetical protein
MQYQRRSALKKKATISVYRPVKAQLGNTLQLDWLAEVESDSTPYVSQDAGQRRGAREVGPDRRPARGPMLALYDALAVQIARPAACTCEQALIDLLLERSRHRRCPLASCCIALGFALHSATLTCKALITAITHSIRPT